MADEKRYGLQKVTLVDYPGEVAATIFTTGCNMHCPYCHNAQLAAGEISAAFFSLNQLYDYFENRCNKNNFFRQRRICINVRRDLPYER